MFNSAGEIEKLEQYFAELFRRLGHGAATATGEKFFRMWEEACNPLPFIVPKEGLRIGETVLIQPEKDKDAKRVACLSWDAEGQCPSLLVETAEKSVIQRLGFKDGAIVFGESIEIDAAMPEESEGEKVEVMSAVAKIIKRDYPQMDLKTVKKEYIKKALIELQETQPSKTAKKLIRRTGLYKELMAKVLSEMAEDERDAQLAFTFDNDPPSSVAAAVNPEGALEGVLPVRGDWEVKRDLDLLCETENRQLHCEETFELSFEGAKVIVPCHDGMEVVQLPLPTDLSIPLREGSRLELYPAGMPKATIGYFTVDVLDESTFIGTIGWSENEYQVDGELRGKPRKSPQGYVTRVVNMMRDTTQDRAMTGQLALRGMLGIMPLPYFYPAEETTADFPMLDSQQARAVRACLDMRNAVVLVQGPPGTGKTSVLEQVVRELAKKHLRILVTAPSNTAVDNICRRLFDLPLLRHSAAKESMRSDVAEQCWCGDANLFSRFVLKTKKMQCEIHAGTHIGILRSPILASRIADEGLFDVIVFDEAGMSGSTEVLSCVCLAKRAFFFGDPKQLPPFPLSDVVWEQLEEEHALTQFQRYFIGGGFMGWLQDCRKFPVIMLKTCYRCQNPRLMHFSSQLFYDAQVMTNGAAEYYKLSYKEREAKYPPQTLKFMDTSGLPDWLRHEQLRLEGFQPGYENYAEAVVCTSLMLSFIKQYPKEEVCLITPYRRQAKLIRVMMRLNRPDDMDEAEWEAFTHDRISTVDSFQGGESDVVIVSYVRSGEHGIGFVNDANRVNVTHTRSRREMVVVGDLEHLTDRSDNRMFTRMRRGFERDGVVEELTLTDYNRLAADVKTTPELSAHVQMPSTEDGKPLQLQLFE
jgi:KaiC/GvpD/RAD55 family RecA-like ATPase